MESYICTIDNKKANLEATRIITLDSLKRTKPEILLGASFERLGIFFTAQKSIAGTVLVDIFLEPNICIFIDGDYWHNYPIGLKKDGEQNKLLKSWGYEVFRIWEHEVLNNPELAAYTIIKKYNIKIRNDLEDYFK